jgi:poly(hydroxyalkanoate) granule-associated protein
MVTKTHKKSIPAASPAAAAEDTAPGGTVKDSAQQIWQAGLGAFTRAQAEGSKAFEALVKEGVSMQRKTQAAAEERMAEAASKMTSMASEISGKAAGQWDKLETIFEDRVAKALSKLGVPSAKEVDDLVARIEALNRVVQELSAQVNPSQPKARKTVAPKATGSAKKAVTRPRAKT